MSSERLTDEELTYLRESDGEDSFELSARQLFGLVDELRDRRLRDLTAEDMEALRFARYRLVEYPPESGSYVTRTKAALAVLSKLLDGWGGE